MALAEQIRRRRLEQELTLTQLARLAKVSKGYLSQLENGPESPRPSADVLYRIAFALGTTVGDLLEREPANRTEQPITIPPGLRQFAAKANLSQQDIAMLAQIKHRGQQPILDPDDWRFLYESIQRILKEDQRKDESDEPTEE
jgi:DNA-binding XRE family transcriptional regulator